MIILLTLLSLLLLACLVLLALSCTEKLDLSDRVQTNLTQIMLVCAGVLAFVVFNGFG